MNPSIASAIVTALSAGAYFVALGLADEQTQQTYLQLKEYLFLRETPLTANIQSLELEPSSPARAMALRAELQLLGTDLELIHLARHLIDLLAIRVSVARGSISMNKETLKNAKMILTIEDSPSTPPSIQSITGDMVHHSSLSSLGNTYR